MPAIDLVRGTAVVGMLVQHGLWSSGWLSLLGDLPVVIFVVALGAGAGLRHARAQGDPPGARSREWLDAGWRIAGLSVLGVWLIQLEGPIAVVLPMLAFFAAVLELLSRASGRAASLAALVLGCSALVLHVVTASMPSVAGPPQRWADAIDAVGVGSYPVLAWLLPCATGYAAGRYWPAVSARLRVVGAAAALVFLSTLAIGHTALRAVPEVGGVVFASHGLWEWDHADGTSMEVLDLARLTPYSGSPAMVLLTTSLAALLGVVAEAVLRRRAWVGRALSPLTLLGRMALTAYVLHVALTSRCMAVDDLAWRCGELRDGRIVLAQLVACLALAAVWRRLDRPTHGPVELLLRIPGVVRGVVRTSRERGGRREPSDPASTNRHGHADHSSAAKVSHASTEPCS